MKRVRHLTAVLLPCRQELSCPQTTVCCVAIGCYGETSMTMGAFFGGLGDLVRKCVFRAIMVGPMPNHVAFIMDGNRRFAAKENMAVSDGHRAGSRSMMAMLDYIYQLGVKYVTGYAFSIENFKRKPEEVRDLMDIIVDMTEELLDGSLVEKHETRVYFIGNLGLLSERVQLAADRAMEATAKNSRTVLLICVAYTSPDEIVHAVQESCKGKSSNARIANGSFEESPKEDAEKTSLIKLGEIERNMYMAVAPDPDTVIRNSGETRLSNFLLWQTADSPLYSPAALWLELVYRHLIREMLQYQRSYPYFHRYLS